MNVDLLSTFWTFINHGYYVRGIYNEKHIQSKSAYEKENYNHDFFVIGYDNNFYSVGFVADSRFGGLLSEKVEVENNIQLLQTIQRYKTCAEFFAF